MELLKSTPKVKKIRLLSPGISLCILVGLGAHLLGSLVPTVGGPVFAIVLGILINSTIKTNQRMIPGIDFTGKTVLQWAVVLLGFKLTTATIVKTGIACLPVIIATITVALILAYVLFKIFKVPEDQAILIGIGSCICGGSAIAAGAATIKAKKEDIAVSLGVIFLFNIIAALIFPTLGHFINLSNEGFALFAGTAVNDTSSVTATALAWDQIHQSNILTMATAVKLTRTLAIIPITLTLSLIKNKQAGGKFQLGKIFPTFILYFLLASLIASRFDLSPIFQKGIFTLANFLIVMAMGAIGLNTRPKALLTNAQKPLMMGLVIWIAIIVTSLSVQQLLNLN